MPVLIRERLDALATDKHTLYETNRRKRRNKSITGWAFAAEPLGGSPASLLRTSFGFRLFYKVHCRLLLCNGHIAP